MRDITLGETFYHFFTTRAFATGVPTQLAGSPVLSVLEENNATPITSGVSLSVDRATVTGLNQATIVATGGNGYAAGMSYAIYISTGTVGGVSVVGEVVGEFTIQASSAFTRLGAPAGASVSADILVLDNLVDDLESRLGTPSNLGSGATVAANLVDIEGQTDDIGVAGAGLTNIGTIATVTTLTNLPAITANWLTATGINADAFTAAKFADDVSTEFANKVWDTDATGRQTAGTFGQAIGDPGADTTTIYQSVVTDAAGANVAADIIAIKAETAAILDDTDDIGVAGAGLTAINLPDQTMNITGDITGNLSGSVGSVSGAVGSVTGAVGSVTGTIGGLTAAALKDFFDTDSTTTYASAVAGSVVKEIADNAGGGTPPSAADIADAVWEEAQADHVGAGTFGVTASEIADILTDTGTTGVPVATGGIASTSFAAGAIDAAAIAADAITSSELAQSAAQEIADEVLNRDLVGGSSGNTRNVRNTLRAIRNKVSEAGGTLTVTEEDDVTPAWTASVTRSAGTNPITTVDPA